MAENKNATVRKIFVRDLRLDAYIGCYAHEQGAPQPVVIDFDIEVIEPEDPMSDRLDDVVCYNRLTQGVKNIIAEGHIKLVETLAERIADMALDHPMVRAVTISVAKPDAMPEVRAAGVTIIRSKV